MFCIFRSFLVLSNDFGSCLDMGMCDFCVVVFFFLPSSVYEKACTIYGIDLALALALAYGLGPVGWVGGRRVK